MIGFVGNEVFIFSLRKIVLLDSCVLVVWSFDGLDEGYGGFDLQEVDVGIVFFFYCVFFDKFMRYILLVFWKLFYYLIVCYLFYFRMFLFVEEYVYVKFMFNLRLVSIEFFGLVVDGFYEIDYIKD